MLNQRPLTRQKARVAVILFSIALLAACGKEPKQKAGQMKVPVSVVTVEPVRAEISVDLPGRVEAIKDAEIRARVTGIVSQINFKQGSEVKEDQLLFTIDSAPYRAVRDQAAAQLKRAQADAHSARLLANRYSKLIKAKAISQQEYDNARAQAAQADAAVAAAQATLQSAEIDLGYTTVVSPIDGRIGKSLVTEGALVSASGATEMAKVQQLDQVYVDLTRSTTQLAQLRRAFDSGALERVNDEAAKAHVILDNDSLYDQTGKLLFSGVTVDPSTGQVSLRALFPNPDHILLPGMYVRVRLQQGIDQKALMVPLQAIQRSADGLSSLMLVKDGKVQVMAVTVGPEMDNKAIINKGLQPGDVVIVEGFQKIRPGVPVQASPWKNPSQADNSKQAGADKSGLANGAEPSGDQSGAEPAPTKSDAEPAPAKPDARTPSSDSAAKG